jgi:hypothetical protein
MRISTVALKQIVRGRKEKREEKKNEGRIQTMENN